MRDMQRRMVLELIECVACARMNESRNDMAIYRYYEAFYTAAIDDLNMLLPEMEDEEL